MAPKPESSITRTNPSPSTFRTLIIPLPYKASLITGATEARICKPAHTPHVSCSLDSHAFRAARITVQSRYTQGLIYLPRYMFPCFSDPRHGEDCRSIPYLVVACVLHCGGTSITFHPALLHMPPRNGEQTTASPSSISEHRYRVTRF